MEKRSLLEGVRKTESQEVGKRIHANRLYSLTCGLIDFPTCGLSNFLTFSLPDSPVCVFSQ